MVLLATCAMVFVAGTTAHGAVEVSIIVFVIVITWWNVRVRLASSLPESVRIGITDTNVFIVCFESSLAVIQALGLLDLLVRGTGSPKNIRLLIYSSNIIFWLTFLQVHTIPFSFRAKNEFLVCRTNFRTAISFHR